MNDNETRVFENHAQDARVREVGEKWTQRAVAPTLNTFDLTSAVRTVTLVVEEGYDNGNH